MAASKPKPTSVKMQQVQVFLTQPATTLDQELTERYAADVYNLADDRILTITEDNRCRRHGKLYASRSDFQVALEAREKQWAGRPGESSFIPARKVLKLLEDPGWFLDSALEKLYGNGIHYRHQDGRILWLRDPALELHPCPRNGLLYPSEAAYRKLLQPQHLLQASMPQQEHFIQEIPQLLEALPGRLSMAPEKLDFTPASVGKLEWAVKRFGKMDCVAPEIFPCLLAYLGEILCRTTGAHWQLRLSVQDGRTWEPWIVMPSGHSCQFFTELYDQLYEGPIALPMIITWGR